MNPRRVVLAPYLLQKLVSEQQPLSCTNLAGENVRKSGTPGEAPAQQHRLAHPGLRSPRHRHRDPRPAGGHAERRLHRQPRPVPPPPAPTPAAPNRGLDQPAQQGGPHTDQLTRSCLNRLDNFPGRREVGGNRHGLAVA
jgi:hypothetical protein